MRLSIALGAFAKKQAVSTTSSTATISSAAHKPVPASSKEAGKEGESPLAGPLQVAAESSFAEKSTFELLRWMFSFLSPVKSLAITACSLLIVWIAYNMLRANVVLALVALAVTPIMFGATSWLSDRARSAFRQVRSRVGDVNASLQENLSAVREAQAFTREDQNIETFSESNAASRDASIRAVAYTSALQPTLS